MQWIKKAYAPVGLTQYPVGRHLAALQSRFGSRFYNPTARARAFGDAIARDVHGNVAGAIGDLCQDGAFDGWKVLLMRNDMPFGKGAMTAIEKKGWKIFETQSVADCTEKLRSNEFDIFMVLSNVSHISPLPSAAQSAEWLKAIKAFHKSGRGVLIAADNEPYTFQANFILQAIFGVTVKGDTPGGGNLSPGDPSKNGHFDANNHLITAGIEKQIYEGVTICYPTNLDWRWTVFGMSSDGFPVFASTSDDYSGASADKPGRIVIDCGFTKFYDGYFEEGAATNRYLSNAFTWLGNVERFQEPSVQRKK